MSDAVLKTTEQKMSKSIESLQRELAGIRTGAANSSMLDRVTVIITEQIPNQSACKYFCT